ncbi:hypothetical protein ACFOMD_04845 [Sphingoaurantiacus capsulatus]|uniref:BD-FAE-like domain-containing protein n=1 Tax=Sphingoaurantiacus capsulatus TaxID=1771310 RepID=A0ABV7X6X8_9SPHN
MRSLKSLILVALVALMPAAGVRAQVTEGDLFGGEVMRPAPTGRTLRYGEAKEETIRVYRGRGSGSAPVTLLFDASDTSSRHRNYVTEELIRALTDRGIAVVSIKGDSKTLGGEMDSVRRSLQFVVANAAKERLDLSRIALTGYSFGVHLAGLLATDPTYLRSAGLDFEALRAAMFLDGGLMSAAELATERAKAPSGSYWSGDAAVVAALVPEVHLASPNVPRVFFANFKDSKSRTASADTFADQLKAAGVDVKVHTMMPGDGAASGEPDRRSFRLIREFIEAALKPPR